MLNYIL